MRLAILARDDVVPVFGRGHVFDCSDGLDVNQGREAWPSFGAGDFFDGVSNGDVANLVSAVSKLGEPPFRCWSRRGAALHRTRKPLQLLSFVDLKAGFEANQRLNANSATPHAYRPSFPAFARNPVPPPSSPPILPRPLEE
jgi:hypothetical protein